MGVSRKHGSHLQAETHENSLSDRRIGTFAFLNGKKLVMDGVGPLMSGDVRATLLGSPYYYYYRCLEGIHPKDARARHTLTQQMLILNIL